jgi:basic membrane protein A and related proteins
MNKKVGALFSILLAVTMLLTACAPAAPAVVPTAQIVVQTQIVEKPVVSTVIVQSTVVVQQTLPPDEMTTAKAFLKGKKFCAVLPGSVNDGGWNEVAYKGLINLRDNFGMVIDYREQTKTEDAPAVMRAYADAGCNIILGHGSEFTDATNAVAKEYPNIQFMQLSRCTGQDPNVIGMCYSTGEGGYFIGLLAGQITKTGKIAYVVGTKYPNMDWHPTMSQQAVKDLKAAGLITKDVIVTENEVGSWDDTAKAKELTTALIAQGYDVIIMIADAADAGSIQAIKEARAAGKQVMGISWSADKNYLGPSFVIGGWDEKSDFEIQYAAVQYALAGKPIGKGFPLGVRDGANGLNPMYGLVPTTVENYVVDALNKYLADPKAFPNLVVRTDL